MRRFMLILFPLALLWQFSSFASDRPETNITVPIKSNTAYSDTTLQVPTAPDTTDHFKINAFHNQLNPINNLAIAVTAKHVADSTFVVLDLSLDAVRWVEADSVVFRKAGGTQPVNIVLGVGTVILTVDNCGKYLFYRLRRVRDYGSGDSLEVVHSKWKGGN